MPDGLDGAPLADEELEAGARVRDRRLRDVALAGAELHGVDFEEVHFVGGDLSGSRWENGGLQDCVVERTNLANLRAVSSGLIRVRLVGCRMTGMQWAEGLWRDVEVTDCRADLVALRRTRLERVTFRDCVLSEADLLEARLRQVRLERCSLVGADVSEAHFDRCVLAGCDLAAVRGIRRLDGITMSWPDIVDAAGTFAAALGVRVAANA